MSWTKSDRMNTALLSKAGCSNVEIASYLGKSPNQVTSLLFRLRQDEVVKPRKRPAAPRLVAADASSDPAFVSVPEAKPRRKAKGNLSITDLTTSQCRWPITADAPFLFCGDARKTGSSYCEAHHEVAVVKRKVKPL